MQRKLDGFEAVVPLVADELHPLHGVYDRACASCIATLLNRGETKVSALLNHVFWSELGDRFLLENGVDLNFVSNIKTFEDYEAMRRLEKLGSNECS
ncbi:Molybdenum cofactor guanylyltransferase [compost metagenome]